MIDSQFLNGVSDYVDSRIAKVVLNGNYEITNFEIKEVTDNTVAMQFIVPASDISLLTLIELKDSSDELITSNEVNVPVNADLLMLQTVEVKEVV